MPSKSILIIQKKPPGPAGFSGGTPVSISLIPEGFTAKIFFTKNRENRKFSGNRKIQPHALFKGTTAGDKRKKKSVLHQSAHEQERRYN